MKWEWLNGLSLEEAVEQFHRCCGSYRWAEGMAASRPFEDFAILSATASRLWEALDEVFKLEAFSHHPRIGDRKHASGWAEGEQKRVEGAAADVLEALAHENRVYEDKFGHVFLTCATGKTAQEMLENLRARLGNDPRTEFAVASAEQAKITKLRLEKLLS